jgi:hypothetical protein
MDAAQGPATGGQSIGVSPWRPTTLLGRPAVFGKRQMSDRHEPSLAPRATRPAVDPEAATGELAVEHVMSGFGRSGALSLWSAWSRAWSRSAAESSTQSMEQARSREQSRFLKRVGRTETEESQLEMDGSLAVYDEELLRAVPGSTLLGCSGRAVMSSSQGCEATFSLSKPVMCMRYFVSHSWETPAWMKMVCLMYEMNASRAVIAAVATQIVIEGLQFAGLWDFYILPPVSIYMVDGQRIRVRSLDAHWTLSCLVFLLVLRWGQAIPVRESFCFLDKCCINQTDSVKKAAGIKQLGAFLRNSEYLLVLWQPEYLTRLWCIYELAAFSHVNRGSCDRVLIRPLKLSVFAVALCAFYICVPLCYHYLTPYTLYSRENAEWMVRTMPGKWQQTLYLLFAYLCMGSFGLYLPVGLLFWKFCKWHVRDLRTLLQQLSEFRLADTRCQVAEDRIFILGQITEWFGSADEFEVYVRNDLHSRVEKLLKDQGPIPYGKVLVGSVGISLFCFSAVLAESRHGETAWMWRLLFNAVLQCLCATVIAVHLILRFAETSIGEDIEGASFFKRKLAGPLLTAFIFSIVTAGGGLLLYPGVPLWYGPIHCVVAAAVTARFVKRDWWHRAALRLPCLCSTWEPRSSDFRPSQPRELNDAR